MVLKNGWKRIPRLRVSPGNIGTFHACPPALGMNLGFGVCHVCRPTDKTPVQPSTVNRHVHISDPIGCPPPQSTSLMCGEAFHGKLSCGPALAVHYSTSVPVVVSLGVGFCSVSAVLLSPWWVAVGFC